jgi:hypothetical protein
MRMRRIVPRLIAMYIDGYLLSRLHRAAFMDTNGPKATAPDSPLVYFFLRIQYKPHIIFTKLDASELDPRRSSISPI